MKNIVQQTFKARSLTIICCLALGCPMQSLSQDVTPPTLVVAVARCNFYSPSYQEVFMSFSEQMDLWVPVTVTVDNTFVFHVGEGFGWQTGSVLGILSYDLFAPGTHSLSIAGARDLSGNPLSPDPTETTFTIESPCDTNPPAAISAVPNCDRTVLTVTFNEPMDYTSSTDPFNYVISGNTIACDYPVLRPDLVTVDVPLCAPLPPGPHVLTIYALVDVSGNFRFEQQITIPGEITCIPLFDCETNVFELRGTACSAPELQVFVGDSCDGPCGSPSFMAGPYSPGTILKFSRSQCDKGARFVRPLDDFCGTNAITAHVKTKSDPVIIVTDGSQIFSCEVCPLAR